MIDEAELRNWSPEQRRQLQRMLANIDEPRVLRDRNFKWRRRLSLLLFMGACVVLAGWIVLLMLTLPKHYTAGHWRGAWVGFDFALLGAFLITAWASWKERQVLIVCLTVTGTLLCCDAWFDLILDLGTHDIWMSLFSAVIAELPLAFIMFTASRRLLRMSVGIVMKLEGIISPVPSLRRIPLFAEGLEAALPARYRNGESARLDAAAENDEPGLEAAGAGDTAGAKETVA